MHASESNKRKCPKFLALQSNMESTDLCEIIAAHSLARWLCQDLKHVDFITIVYFSNLSKFGHTDSLPLVPKHMNSVFILYMHIHFPNFF